MVAATKSRWTEIYLLEGLVFAQFFAMPFAIAALTRAHLPFLAAAIVYGVCYLYTGYRAASWQCPNCGQSFLRNERTTVVFPFRRKCANCKIQAGAEPFLAPSGSEES
ncbi:hypothetical protein SAMN05443244_3200 [Terriglobus roseus]|uniref:Uncharacterized protein n=1 Tax=Terriglobus roseus TaxID=392734 RepID=A0A1H4RNB0_9BACT|nr:hypothetical protein SAMN05443244_3200 [Terriglobus roseus]